MVILLTSLFSCKGKERVESDTIKNVVGEIFHDKETDGDFEICGIQEHIIQYYAFNEKVFKGEKSALIRYFKKRYRIIPEANQSGLIRIRFIVNCRGEAGRFRLLAMNSDYQKVAYADDITDQLLSLIKNFKGWKPMQAGAKMRDYYQYLIFKIANGELIEIMP